MGDAKTNVGGVIMRHSSTRAAHHWCLISLASIASAADLPARAPVYKAAPPVAAYSWTGFYVGANAGYAWGHSNTTSSFHLPSTGCMSIHFFQQVGLLLVRPVRAVLRRVSRVVGRLVTIHQIGQLLVGVELDIESFRLSSSLAGAGLVLVGAGV